MEFHGIQPLIIHSELPGYASALADGEAAYLLWLIGAFTLITFLIGLRRKAREASWYCALQGVALLALPALLLVGMVASMMPPA